MATPAHRLLAVAGGAALLAAATAACGASSKVEAEIALRNAAAHGALAQNGSRAASSDGGSLAPGLPSVALSAAPGVASGFPSGSASGTGSVTPGAGATPVPQGGNGGATDIGVTATSVRIGGTFFNGNYLDKYSQVTEQDASAYFRYINDQGGIYGRKIDFHPCDTAGTADGTQGCLTKLAENDRVFAMGPSLDFNLNTVQQYLAQHQLPWVGTSGLYPEEFTSPYMFPTQLRGFDVGALITTFAAQKLGVKSIVVSYLNDVAGPECTRRAQDVAQKLGVQFKGSVSNGQTEGDLSSQVIQARSQSPDTVIFCNDPVNTVKFIQAASRQSYKPPMGWVAGFVAADDIPQSIGTAAVGMYGFTAFDFYRSDTPGIRKFRQITEYYYPGTFHHFYTQAAYTGSEAVVAALRLAGPNLTRKGFIAAIRTLNDFDSTMGLHFNFANLASTQTSSGLMLQVDKNLNWQVASVRFRPAG